MNKILAMVLTLCLVMGMVIHAYAEDDSISPEVPQKIADVSTFEELKEAIAAAEDGDSISIAATIYISGENLECDQDITFTRADGFGGSLITLYGGRVAGLSFAETNDCSYTLDIRAADDETFIENCKFMYEGEEIVRFIEITGGLFSDTYANIQQCSFIGATDSAISAKGGTFVMVDSSRFDNNSSTMTGGAIRSTGNMKVIDSTFANGVATSGGGIFSSSSLTITNCQFENNTVTNPLFGSDIFSIGTLSIMDESEDDEGFYEETTGEKIVLPLTDYIETAKLIYLTTEQAAEYFPPAATPEPESTQMPEPDHTLEPEPEPTQIPEPDPTSPPDMGDQATPTQTPTTPPNEPSFTPTSTPSATMQPTQEPTQSPIYPPVVTPTEKPTETPTTTPVPTITPTQEPQATPIPEPTQQPTKPVEPTPESTQQPTMPTEPTAAPTIEPPKPTLICGDARIDTSRTVVLRGYGDGQLHEDEPLTRAQLATVIYRLLDDESIEKYSSGKFLFVDVPTNAWYTKYVRTISNAGIVHGIGEGRYSPNSNVTWSQIVTVLTRFVEPQEYSLQHIPYSGWANQAIQTAVALGWIEDSVEFQPNAVISRGDLVEFVNEVLAQNR